MKCLVWILLLFVLSVQCFTPRQVLPGFECSVCQYVVDGLVAIIGENQTLGFTPFHQQANGICEDTFSDQWLVGYCMYWVDDNCLELYNILVKRGDPKVACRELNACTFDNKRKVSVQNPPQEKEDFDFSFVVLSDTHIGQASDTAYTTWLTKVSVDKVNSLIEAEKIQFAFITGDITDSAMRVQWLEARREFDRLFIPYFPLIGNRDQWSYDNKGGDYEEPFPTGDRQFAETFKDRFFNPGLPGVEIIYNNQSTYNPEQNITSWFQNYQMNYGNLSFLALDWNSREHAPRALGYKGSLPLAELHDFPGGTLPWLHERVSVLSNSNRQVVLLQHHPFATPDFVPGIIYSFPEYAKERILQELAPLAGNYWGLLAGHLHVWFNGVQSDKQWLTEATKVGSSISLVRVKGGQIQSISRLFGYDY